MIFYRLALRFVMFVLRLILPILPTKIQKGYRQRRQQPWKNISLEAPIWIHCSSGEFEYAKPVIREIKKENPKSQILVTYFSPSVEGSLKSNPDIDAYCISPWDTVPGWSEFFETTQPKALLIARTDIWPEMIWQSFQRKIPITMFSVTIGSSSSKLSAIGKLFYRPLFEKMQHVFVVSDSDLENLRQINSTCAASVSGDTRYDQVAYRLQTHNPKVDSLAQSLSLPPTQGTIFASIWPEDLKVVGPTWIDIAKTHPLIIVPHENHEDFLQDIEGYLSGIPHKRYSQWHPDDRIRAIIVDKVGLLANLYPLARFSFVGGSFKRQVHSVMESLACGCQTFVGPFYKNNREAIEFQQFKIDSSFAVISIASSSQFLKELQSSSVDDNFSSKLQAEIQHRQGASTRLAHYALNLPAPSGVSL